MKKLLLSITLVALSLNANAKFTQKLNIKYQKEYSWSNYYYVNVTITTGFELNDATSSYDYNSYSTYAVIFWGEGQATIIKLSNYLGCGYEATPLCIQYNYSLEGKDQNGNKWYICLTDYCY